MSFSEILIIAIIAIILIKPKDLPKIILGYKRIISKISYIKNDLTNIINTISHNQEILEIEKILKNKSELKEPDIEIIYNYINEKIKSGNIAPNIIQELSKKNTIH